MIFPENYYRLHEIFKIESTGQQCFVVSDSVRKADNMWSVMVRLLDDDYSSVLDTNGTHVGDYTYFIGNAKPELHDTGKLNKPVLIFLIAGKSQRENQQQIFLILGSKRILKKCSTTSSLRTLEINAPKWNKSKKFKSMKYIVYLTINKINNKIYIGVHGTETPDKFDGYLGNAR